MNTFTRAISTWPRRAAIGTMLALGIALPQAVSATQAVMIEGAIGVANVTTGETDYKPSTNASYDQVVKVEVAYHNRELADSGKIAENVRVKIDMPTTAGTSQQIKGTISGDNTNTVSKTATVNLNRGDATLQYIPGSAVWKHNVGDNTNIKYQEEKISDNVVMGGQGLVLEDEKPCYNYAATVTVLARVMVPGVTVTKQSELKGDSNKWSTNNTAKPGDTMKYMIGYQNTGNTVQNNVIIRDSLPAGMTIVPGTTQLKNATFPNGTKFNSDDVVNGGIRVGTYQPGANAYVMFEVKVPAADQLSCGATTFRNVGLAKPEGMSEYYTSAVTTVTKTCAPTTNSPDYACDLLTLTQNGQTVTASVKYHASNGAKLKSVTYDFGNGSTPLTTDKTTVSYTYPQAGNYTVTAKLLMNVNGADKSVTSESCAQPISFTTPTTPATPTTPGTTTELPNTGMGSVLGIFAATSVAGAVAYRLFLGRRLAHQS